ncbi:MAG: type II toxin-antitoxin system HicA family toxin [Desulfamplus sp.]|nr:type II toxin-antitoxin system HicA family toxin [Desulfamplus sp.]
MPPFGPVKRKEFLKYLGKLGFNGPYSGGKHQFMVKEDLTIRVPNPHQSDIGKELLSRLLRQIGISRDEWEQL